MTELVRCPACGIKTSASRSVCPRCETSLASATVCGMSVTPARQLPPPREIDAEQLSAKAPTDGDETQTPAASVFDTDISELFPKRARFSVIDLLLLAGVVAWLAVLSDVRVWVEDGVVSFATASAREGVTRAAVASTPQAEPVLAESVDMLENIERDIDEVPTSAAAPKTEPLPAASVSMRAGNRLFENGEFRAAVTQFEAAVAVAPDDAEGWNNLGQTLVRLDRRTEAVRHFEEAVRLNPGRWAYHFNLGHTLAELGWWHRAVVQYRHAVALFPDDFATHYNLGRALQGWGDDRAAIASYLKAIALAPDEPSFYLSLAQSYEALARPADVAAAYARYLGMEPESAQADVIRARLEILRHPATDGPESTR